jgi:large subunit ribosomal protein L7/L12
VRTMAEDTQKDDKKVSKKVSELVDQIAELSVLDLSELVNALQDKLGVTAMAPMAAPAAAGAAPEGDAPAAEAAGGGTVIMTASGDNKIAVIKALREINQNWGLKEAKDMTDNVPAEILKDAKPEDAKAAADKLKAAGATVELK